MMHYSRFLGLFTICLAWCSNGFAQLTEIAPFDTASAPHANAGRIFSDAVKENILGNTREAEVLFMRFAEAEPKEAATYYELARIAAKNNQKEKALQQIQKAMSLDTGNKWYREFYGNILADTRKYAEGAEVFSKLARQFKPNDDYFLKASLLYERSGQYKKSVTELEALLQQRGFDEEVLMQISQIYLKENKLEEAVKTVRRLIVAAPREARYHTLLAEMYLNNKQEEKAFEVLKAAEQLFPADVSVQLGFASYYKRKNNNKEYLDYAAKAITAPELDEDTRLKLLLSYLQDIGSDTVLRNESVSTVRKVVELHPKNATLHGVLGDLLSLQGANKESLAEYKVSLRLDSTNLNTWQQILFSFTAKQDADSLIAYSEAALGLFPASAMIYYLNGIGHSNKGNFDKAVSAITTAIDFQPEDNKGLLAEMYASLADAYHSQKDYAESDKQFEKALALAPDNATVLNNYAYYLSVRKVRLKDAEKYSLKSLTIKPDEPTFLDTYGWIFYQQGDYQKAVQLIGKAISLEGNNADATLYEHLGDAYFKTGALDKAMDLWNKAATLDPTNNKIQQKIKDRKTDD
jgi:tetratricopeptide (TPR) repeat protein